MSKAKKNDKVAISYVGKLEDGNVFDKTPEGEKVEFTIGGGEMIPQLEEQVVGLSPGETSSFVIKAESAYGPYHDQLKFDVPKERFPKELDIKEGMYVQVNIGEEQKPVKIDKIEENNVVIDANHPLAGKDLHFDVKLEEIKGDK